MAAELHGIRRSARPRRDLDPPYPPGWLDRLLDWIDAMPGSNTLYCLGLLAVQLAYLTVLLWFNDKMPFGTIELGRVFAVVVAPYFLWFRFHLDRVAADALDDFRPALAVSDAEFFRMRYELTTLPRSTTRIVTAVALLLALVNFLWVDRSVVQQFAPSRGWAFVELGPISVFTTVVVSVAVVQAIYQLRMVVRIHERASSINLLRTKPLYAFSSLTARTGIAFVLLSYYVAAVRPDIVAASPALQVLLVAMIPTAIACFFVPLYGMHVRIAAEKSQALAESGARLQAVIGRLHQTVDQGVLADADKLNMQLKSLVAERETLSSISTWPWEATTLTAFVSALVLPILLRVLQRLLERTGF